MAIRLPKPRRRSYRVQRAQLDGVAGLLQARHLGGLGLLGGVLAVSGQYLNPARHIGPGPGLAELLARHPGQLWLLAVGAFVITSTIRDQRRRTTAT